MRRKLLNITAAVSLLLWVAVICLWAKSYPGEKWVRDGPRAMTVAAWRGKVMLETRVRTVAPYAAGAPTASRASGETDDASAPSGRWRHAAVTAGQWVTSDTRFGFADVRVTNWSKNDVANAQVYRIERGRLRVVPLWCPFLATTVLPMVWVLRRRATRRRAADGLCLGCGYDLRATPDRCPECGVVPREPHNPPMQRTATAPAAP
jgi:hypothetical protein